MRLLSVLFLAMGFVLDVLTDSSLVVGILLNVPLVLSGLTHSRGFLLQMTVLALLANILAGVLNSMADGTSTTTLLNRLMVTVSLMLVGFLSLRVQDTTLKMAVVELEHRRSERERQLRSILNGFTAPMPPVEFLAGVAGVLQDVSSARAVLMLHQEAGLAAGMPRVNWTAERIAILQGRDTSWILPWEGFQVVLDLPDPQKQDFVKEVLSDLSPLYQQALLREDLELRQRQLQERSEVIRDLMYAFSHDLRTPILANVMSMKLALSGAYGEISEGYQGALKNGIQANQEVLTLAEGLLQVARLEIEEEAPPFSGINLTELVNAGVRQVQPLLIEKDLTPEMKLLEQVWVRGDPTQLSRVLLNLLDNAIKWSPSGGKITVQMQRKGRFVAVSVLDSGPGVPESLRGHLFHRFRKAGAGAGSGLGLYLGSKIMGLHGGRLSYSRSDQRTEFSFTLPEVEP